VLEVLQLVRFALMSEDDRQVCTERDR
jgi:hypothetical protein